MIAGGRGESWSLKNQSEKKHGERVSFSRANQLGAPIFKLMTTISFIFEDIPYTTTITDENLECFGLASKLIKIIYFR